VPIARSPVSAVNRYQIQCFVSIYKLVPKQGSIVETVKFHTTINRRSMIVSSTCGRNAESSSNAQSARSSTSRISRWNVQTVIHSTHRKGKLIGRFSMDSYSVTHVNWATSAPRSVSGGALTNVILTYAMTAFTKRCPQLTRTSIAWAQLAWT
jgi:hypothetical protein